MDVERGLGGAVVCSITEMTFVVNVVVFVNVDDDDAALLLSLEVLGDVAGAEEGERERGGGEGESRPGGM